MKKLLYILLFIGQGLMALAQGSNGDNTLELSSSLSSNTVNYAGQNLVLKPGFNTNGNSFTAEIANIVYRNYEPISPEETYNYIHTLVPQVALTQDTLQMVLDGSLTKQQNELMDQVSYFDGLGRISQEIGVAQAPTYNDIVVHHEYDDFGRESIKNLPFAVTTGGEYVTNPITKIEDFYLDLSTLTTTGEQVYPWAETVFDGSPLNRVMKQGAPGEDWQPDTTIVRNSSEHVVSYNYGTNAYSDSIEILKVTSDNKFYRTGTFYKTGTLYVTTISDENGNKTKEYKNIFGQVILKSSYLSEETTWLETYYVYDDFGLLRYVIPPEATPLIESVISGGSYSCSYSAIGIAGAALPNLCYYYQYDARKRMILKKLPGAEPVYMVYDNRDRLVLTQDGNLRDSNDYLYTIYDELNRPCVTGKLRTGITYQELVELFYTPIFVTKSAAHDYSYEYNFTEITDTISFTHTFYDNYKYKECLDAPDSLFIGSYNGTKGGYETKVKGFVTGTKTRIGETSDLWEISTPYYDEYGRVILSKRTVDFTSTIQGYEIVSTQYNFNGSVAKTYQEQDLNSQTTKVITDMYYDHAGRVFKTRQKVDQQPYETLAKMEYDALGQLKTKKIGDELQSIDYKYNIRGWLNSINDPEDIGTDQFAMHLNYNKFNVMYKSPATGYYPDYEKQYNGNIASAAFVYGNGDATGYCFNYDGLNRLTKAVGMEGHSTYWSPKSAYSTQYSYDLNGNIKSLRRMGIGIANFVDSLTYTYTGNQLNKVIDAGDLAAGFKSTTTAQRADQFTYDDNGNMYIDKNKGITNIVYNDLNLPTKVEKGTNYVEYLYSAAGTKYAKKTIGGTDSRYYFGTFEYDENMELDLIHTGEGRIRVKSSYTYDYDLKDHLGNTRVVVSDDGSGNAVAQQISNYYPFGMRYGQTSAISTENKYLFNGKEFQGETEWYDYGARFYDPALGRWHCTDPMQQFHSPYVYAANNPISNIDPSGMYSYNWNTGEYNDSDGNVVSWNEVQSNNYEEPEKKKEEKEKEKIAIDPGHGDHNNKNSKVDPGAVNGEDYEKDIVLDISEAVKKELAAKGYTITLTRTGDVSDAGTKLQWRIDKASGSNVFVSIHTNSFSKPSANGFQVNYKTGDANSKSLAQSIQKQNTLFTNRAGGTGLVGSSNLYVLNKFSGTAVLVEVGFISNANDLKLMKGNTALIGKQIATGIINYLSK